MGFNLLSLGESINIVLRKRFFEFKVFLSGALSVQFTFNTNQKNGIPFAFKIVSPSVETKFTSPTDGFCSVFKVV